MIREILHINEVGTGNFFALSEGWADFLGMTYAARKYPAPLTVQNVSRDFSTTPPTNIYNVIAAYNTHLENNPTYFNSFIPRGLFHDLIDGGDGEVIFDRIQGHMVQQI